MRRLLIVFVIVWLAGACGRALATQSVDLTWNQSPSASVIAYKVYYGTESGVYPDSVTFAVVSGVTIPGLADGQTYFFAVSAIDLFGNESPLSNEAVYTIPAPASIALQAQGSTAALEAVDLNWTPSPDSDVYGYSVNYGTQSGVYTNSVTFYYATGGTISGLAGGATYYFSVSPIDAYGVMPVASDEASCTVPVPQPIVLNASPPSGSSGVELSWNSVPDQGIVSYYVYYGAQRAVYTQSLSCNGNDVVVHGLTPGQTYYFVVAAVDNYNNQSPFSNEASSPAAAPVAIPLTVQVSTAATRAVDVSWTPSADSSIFGYAVNYWIPGAEDTNSADFYSASDGLISGLTGGATYDFTISPIDAFGVEAVASSVVAYAVPNPPPVVLQAQALQSSPGIELTWNPVLNEGVVSYNVYYGTQSGAYTGSLNFGSLTDVIVRGLPGGQMYYFVVTSVDGYGDESAYSSEASAVEPQPAPMVLQMQTYFGDNGQPNLLEITTPSTVYGSWELDWSSDLKNWSYYTAGTGAGNGDGHDVDTYISIDPTQPQMFFRVVNN